MKLANAALPVTEGSLGMVDFVSRCKALKISLLSRACNTENVQLWQVHLFSFFKVPFSLALKTNLSETGLTHLLRKPLPLFWQDAIKCWISVHLAKSTTHATNDQFKEFVCRPVLFNGALGSFLYNRKRYSLNLAFYLANHQVISVKDLCLKDVEQFPLEGFLSRNQVLALKASIPGQWKAISAQNPNLDLNTIGHNLIHGKLSHRQIYQYIIKRVPGFQEIISRWEKDGFQIDWTQLTKQVKWLLNGTLKCFFILFNL